MSATKRELVLIDLAISVGQGLGAATVTLESVKDWADHYAETVQAALAGKQKWEEGPNRDSAKTVARILGQTAASLAGPQTGAAAGLVDLEMAQRAKAAIKNHPLCIAGQGHGEWCKETA